MPIHPNNLPHAPADPLIRNYLRAHRGWSEGYRKQHLGALNRLSIWLDAERDTTLADATRADLDAYFDWKAAQVCGASANKEWLRARSFYAWAVDDGCVQAPRGVDYGPMEKVAAPPSTDPDPARLTTITPEQYEALMASLGKRKLIDARDGTMYSLMYRTGLRGIEVERADVERLDLDGAPAMLWVLGKGKRGGKWRQVPLSAETLVWLRRYLRLLGPDAPVEGALFLSTDNGGNGGGGRRYRVSAIHNQLERRGEKLGIKLNAHSFRRTAATDARERGINDSDIIEVFGWEDGRMLAHYSRSRKAQIASAAFAAADPTARAETSGGLRRGGRKAPRRTLRAVS